jgi:hypothetical protein
MSMVGNNSYAGVFTVTPSDGADLAIWTDAIRVTGAGNVSLIGADGVTTTCAFAAGETRLIRAKRIRSTGTTATGVEGMHY